MLGLKESCVFQPLWDNYLREEIIDYLTVFLRLVYSGIFVFCFSRQPISRKGPFPGAVL